MLTKTKKLNLIALISALPVSLAIQMVDTPITWFMYTLVIFTFIEATPKEAFKRAILIGISAAAINFFWFLSSTQRFTGKSIFLGIGIMVIFALLFALYAGLLGSISVFLRWKVKNKWTWLYNAMILASLWTLFDAFMIYVAKSFSLCMYVTYITFADNLYALQPTAILGPLIITFVVVFVNYAAAHFIYYRQWKMLPIPFAIIAAYLLFGYVIFNSFQHKIDNDETPLPTVKVAIIAENLLPEYKWDSINGNGLAKAMFELNRRVAQSGANIAVWSESAVPWNFTPNDDFLKEVDKITAGANVTHLVGMNTDYQGRTFYNSVYCMQPGLKIIGRYDKRIALSLIEKPFCGMLLPFFNSSGFRVKEGTSNLPLNTLYGKVGMMLCNESVVPAPAYSMVKNGAQFLVNPGNDGWFTTTYIAKQHFYHARLRAVETRKDVVVNNNNGYSGMIKASGEINLKDKSLEAYIATVTVSPNNYTSFEVEHPYLFAIFSVIILTALSIFNFVKNRQKSNYLN